MITVGRVSTVILEKFRSIVFRHQGHFGHFFQPHGHTLTGGFDPSVRFPIIIIIVTSLVLMPILHLGLYRVGQK